MTICFECDAVICSCHGQHQVIVLQTVGNSGAIKTVQVKGPSSSWLGLNNIWGATWELAKQPTLPIDLHVMADNGQEVKSLNDSTMQCMEGFFRVAAG